MKDTPRVTRQSRTPFRSENGAFLLYAYEFEGGREHSALVAGQEHADVIPIVRVQSACLTGTAFGARLCDCRAQLEQSLREVAGSPFGCVLYLDQEGRGHGLVEKVAQLERIAEGASTLEAALMRGEQPDVRDYAEAVFILGELFGDRAVRLMTNNPAKLEALTFAGLLVESRAPIETEPTPFNREYLRLKKVQMGHLLSRV